MLFAFLMRGEIIYVYGVSLGIEFWRSMEYKKNITRLASFRNETIHKICGYKQ